MQQQEIVNSDKLIADYLNITFDGNEFAAPADYDYMAVYANINYWDERDGDFNLNPYKFLKFHSDWNWLMSVILKIEQGLFAVAIKENECHISGYRKYKHIHFFFRESNTTKFQAAYNTVIQFITWYNQQPK